MQETLPENYYEQLQAPEDIDDMELNVLPDLEIALQEEVVEEQRGMRRPTTDEFERLAQHPFVQRVHGIFRTQIVDARLRV